MNIEIELDECLVLSAKGETLLQDRSTDEQMEFWIRVGRAALDNPDLPASFIAESLVAMQEKREDLSIFEM